MADHVPGIRTADFHAADLVLGIELEAPFLGRSLGVFGRIVGFPFIFRKRVLREIDIGGAYIGVAQHLAHPHERRIVVAGCELVIHDDLDAVFLLQIEEQLLLVAHDQDDVRDAGFDQLLDLALHQDLSANLQKPLGLLVGNRCKAQRQTGCHDDGIVHFVRLEFARTPGRDLSAIDELRARKAPARRIGGAQRDSEKLGYLALSDPRMLSYCAEGIELFPGYHGVSPFCPLCRRRNT